MTKNKLRITLLIGVLIIAGIGLQFLPSKLGISGVEIIPAPTPRPPTPTLRAAASFVEGVADVPANHYLFLDYTSDEYCRSGEDSLWQRDETACVCVVSEAVAIPYHIQNSKEIYIDGLDYSPTEPILGFWGYRRDVINAAIYTLQSLPFTIERKEATLHSVDSDGTVTITIRDETYYLSPGEQWVSSSSSTPDNPNDCRYSYKSRLHNYGFLPKEQIIIDYEYMGLPKIPILSYIQALESDNLQVRQHAAEMLLRLAPETVQAVPALIQSLQDADTTVRQLSAQALGKTGRITSYKGDNVSAALIKLFDDNDVDVVLAAIEALEELSEIDDFDRTGVSEALVELLYGGIKTRCEKDLADLGNISSDIKTKRCLQLFFTSLNNTDSRLVLAAIKTLKQIDLSPAHTPVLID